MKLLDNGLLITLVAVNCILGVLFIITERLPDPPDRCSCAGRENCTTKVFHDDETGEQINVAMYGERRYCIRLVRSTQ